MKTIIYKARSVGMTTMATLPPRRMKMLVKNFYAESPFMRMLMRCGRARKYMQAYRKAKMIRRPSRFRQDVW